MRHSLVLVLLTLAVASTAHAQTLFVEVGFLPEEIFPSAREGHAMAVEASGDLILFGGIGGEGVLNDTWRFDGETKKWSLLTPGTLPPARHRHAMATIPVDSGSTEILMFGGKNSTGLLNDTWRWNGSDWSQMTPNTPPSPRADAMMAADSTGAILFGGNLSATGVNPSRETWRYDGGDWTDLGIPNEASPPARAGGGMSHSEEPYLIALYGGRDGVADLNDTWYFDPIGGEWIQTSQASLPPARHDMTMTWDDLRDRWVMHGGVNGSTVQRDAWELRPDPTSSSPNEWQQVQHPNPEFVYPASANSAAEFVGDVGFLGAVVFFGGNAGSGLLNKTWLYGPPYSPITPQPAPTKNPVPANPMTDPRVLLGHVLFYEEQMSMTRTMACATCHMPEAGGTDPRPAVLNEREPTDPHDDVWGSAGVIQNVQSGEYVPAVSAPGIFGLNPQVTERKSPSNLNAFLFKEQFWDGRAKEVFKKETGEVVLDKDGSMESQAVNPPTASVEMAHMDANWGEVTARLASVTPLALASDIPDRLVTYIYGRTYPALFDEAFIGLEQELGPGVTREKVAMALAAYQRTLLPTQATVLTLGYPGKGTAAERGGTLFEFIAPNSPMCATCHSDEEGNRKTDNEFHYLGVAPREADLGRYEHPTGTLPPEQLEALRGAMKTPSLFNVELHRRFFHNGSKTTLEEVIDFYVDGGEFERDENAILEITLVPTGPNESRAFTSDDKADLVAYLKAFTDPRLLEDPLQPPFDRPKLRSEIMPPNTMLYGVGTGPCNQSPVPAAIAVEPPHLQNNRFVMGVRNGPEDAYAFLCVGTAPAPLPGGEQATEYISFVASSSVFLMEPVGVLSFNPIVGGYTSKVFDFHLGIPAGTNLFCQWVLYSEGPCLVSSSEGVQLTVFGSN